MFYWIQMNHQPDATIFQFIILTFDKLSSGYFPGVWVLKADVSELCVGFSEDATDTDFRNVGF
jgi:hypothetical protein